MHQAESFCGLILHRAERMKNNQLLISSSWKPCTALNFRQLREGEDMEVIEVSDVMWPVKE